MLAAFYAFRGFWRSCVENEYLTADEERKMLRRHSMIYIFLEGRHDPW